MAEVNTDIRQIAPLRDGLRAYYDSSAEKWGYVDARGKVVIAPAFNQVRSFNDGLAAVVKDQSIYFIDKTGQKANNLSWTKDWRFNLSDLAITPKECVWSTNHLNLPTIFAPTMTGMAHRSAS